MQNDLVTLPQHIGTLRKLQCLHVQHNDINELPDFDGCNDLQELHVSNKFIKKVPQRFCSNLPHLKILDLRDNKIVKLPDEISLLQNLTRLDVSNNSLTNLPNSLATLAHLISLQEEGNPIKTIRRDIFQCGTVRILKMLRDRALSQEPVAKGSTSSISSNSDSCNMDGDGLNCPRGILSEVEESIFPDKYKLRKIHCLTVTMQQLTDVPHDIFEMASHENVQMVDFSRNRLNTLPDGLHEMMNVASELIFAYKVITYVPAFISQFTRVTLINLSCNNLSTLSHEFGVLNTLREFNVSHNRFESMPNCVYELQELEISLPYDNRIKSIDASENDFGAMKRLATLDLRNYDVEQVPPILGNLKNITTLDIIGHPFELPRHQTLEKGVEAIMSYLRDRVPA